MSVKPKNQLKSIATMLSLGGIVVVAAGLIYLFFTPKIYQASVKVRMLDWVRANSTNEMHGEDYDIGVECQFARSDAIIDESIKNLGLNEIWGKRFNHGVPLKPEQSRILLKAKISIHPIPKSSLFQIQVTSNEPDEAAKIANDIARDYRDQHETKRQALKASRLEVFRQKWDEGDQKVQLAQAALDKMYVDITRDRTTNPATFHEAVQSKRIELEGQYVEQRDQLDTLKAMNQEQLRQVLPTLDNNSNPLLTTALTQRSKARTDLVIAQSTYSADSPEVNHAALVVNELDKTIAQTIAGIMTAKERELASTKAALDQINVELKRASKNLNEITAQDSAYAQARQNLENFKLARDALQQKLGMPDSHDTSVPADFVTEILDSAEPPQKPVTPDGKIAASTIAAGSLAALAGLILLLVNQKPKSTARKN